MEDSSNLNKSQYCVREFLSELSEEETRLKEYLGRDNVGLALASTVKEFDFYYFNLVRSEKYTEETAEQFDILQLGAPRLIELALKARNKFDVQIATFRRISDLSIKTLELISIAGFIEAGRRMAHMCRAGECTIERIADNQYHFQFPGEIENFDFYEREVSAHYRRELSRIRSKFLATPKGQRLREQVSKLLDDNVYVWQHHFIGYDADPLIDEYFSNIAYSQIQGMDGFDSFHHSLKFGDVTFMNYILAATFFLSLALKHEAFCTALFQRESEIELADILSISCEKLQLIQDIQLFINDFGMRFQNFEHINAAKAEQIYNVLSIGRRNLGLLRPTAAPLPFLVEFSETGLLKSIAGAQMNPLQFLLNSLRHHFPADYDRNQQTREHSMQKAVKRLLLPLFPNIQFRQNIRIRDASGTKTDIDMIAIDKANGTILLFQLKHQDPYGTDIRARSSRSNRLRNETAKWMESVLAWLNHSDGNQIRATLQLNKKAKIEKVRIVILTKHFAHFLSKIGLPENAAYTTWMSFFNTIEKIRARQGDFCTLNGFFSALRDDMVHKHAKPYEFGEPVEYNLSNVKFSVSQNTQINT